MSILLLLLSLAQQPAAATKPDLRPADWKARRVRTLDGMQKVMGPLPATTKERLMVDVGSNESLERVVRKKISFVPEIGDRLTAYLIVPKNVEGKRPAMLCLHQTTQIGKSEPAGLGGKPNLRYALELAERGYVTLAPDYPNYGGYEFDPYEQGYASATMKGIVNHRRCIDLLQSLVEVDPDRIGVIGHSLGGHNALFVAAFDERLKVVVTSCGFTSFPKYYGGNLKGWTHKGYMPRIASEFGNDPKRMPFDFPEILASLAPRAVFINAPLHDDNFEVSGVRDCVRLATPAFELFKAKDKLVAEHPDCRHDFPPDVRKRAYEFIDKNLSSAKTSSPVAPRKDSNPPLSQGGRSLRITP